MKYVYPAVFTAYENGGYMVSFPDLPGCNTEADDLYDVLYEAEGSLIEFLECLIDEKMPVPAASRLEEISLEPGQFVNLIRANVRRDAA